MAISSAVQPVRVESTESNQKTLKSVTIIEPPIITNTKGCAHLSIQNCSKCRVVSNKQHQDKKSILINKEKAPHTHVDSTHLGIDNENFLPRRHSEDISQIAKIKTGNKPKPLAKTTDNLYHSNESIKSKSNYKDGKNITKSNRIPIQRTSSLKNPSRRAINQHFNVKTLNVKANKKGQSSINSSSRSGSSPALNIPLAKSCGNIQPKSHSTTITKVIVIKY